MTRFSMRLPATSANLGPCFDTAAVAVSQFLHVEAVPSKQFSITATGLNADLCGSLQDNLLIETYRQILQKYGQEIIPLAITMHNEIPLGMGCGSSAAVLLAAVSMASQFGGMDWDDDRILQEACRIEGHPDNVAACWEGGLTIAAMDDVDRAFTHTVRPPESWRALLVLPDSPLATVKARAVLPQQYSRADVVQNIQSASLLGLAWSSSNGKLLSIAMRDRIHQPYREEICPLLPALLPLTGSEGVLGVALSGAGPAVLLVLAGESYIEKTKLAVEQTLQSKMAVQFIAASFQREGAKLSRLATCP